MNDEIEKPEDLEEDHLEYLDYLRDSGETNMFGARSYLMDEFPNLDEKEAGKILSYWMKTYSKRHK